MKVFELAKETKPEEKEKCVLDLTMNLPRCLSETLCRDAAMITMRRIAGFKPSEIRSLGREERTCLSPWRTSMRL